MILQLLLALLEQGWELGQELVLVLEHLALIAAASFLQELLRLLLLDFNGLVIRFRQEIELKPDWPSLGIVLELRDLHAIQGVTLINLLLQLLVWNGSLLLVEQLLELLHLVLALLQSHRRVVLHHRLVCQVLLPVARFHLV